MARRFFFLLAVLAMARPLVAAGPAKPEPNFPPPETKGGWPSLLPESGEPDDAAKAKIRKEAGVDWDRLRAAWEWNGKGEGKTGLLVIRHGKVVGEWYRDCDRTTDFNIYSSSKAYTSLAYGLILDEFGGELPGGKTLALDTKVCNPEWLPESLPLPDGRKAEITVRHLLNMASGLGEEQMPGKRHYEWALGHVEDSPFAKLKDAPGEKFHYSNAGVAHLVLVFHRATGVDLFPFLKERILDPIGVTRMRWTQVGGDGGIGPFSQGFSGVMTNAREHARFCTLALHRGTWDGKRLVPEDYYDFAWKSSPANPSYGAQWWVYPKFSDAPRDLVQTAGARNNHGYVIPSLDLVVVRVGDGNAYPKDFERELIAKILAAVDSPSSSR